MISELAKEIAGELECGLRVFVHKENNSLVSIPDEDKFLDIEDELWKETKRHLKKNARDYFEIEKWSAREEFELMAQFAEQKVKDKRIQNILMSVLSERKPFSRFKEVINQSGPYRQKWLIL